MARTKQGDRELHLSADPTLGGLARVRQAVVCVWKVHQTAVSSRRDLLLLLLLLMSHVVPRVEGVVEKWRAEEASGRVQIQHLVEIGDGGGPRRAKHHHVLPAKQKRGKTYVSVTALLNTMSNVIYTTYVHTGKL